jgi:hypothetical protein
MEKILNIIIFGGVILVLLFMIVQPKTSLREDYEKSIEACNHNPTCIQEINEGIKNMGYAIENEVSE